jgi:hypothetical protein
MMVAALCMGMVACDKNEKTADTTPDVVAGATIVRGTISSQGIDMDNDGTLDFRLSADGTYLSYDWSEGGNNIVNSAAQWDIIDPLQKNTLIGPNSRFEGQGDAMLELGSATPEKFYVGLRFLHQGQLHYGWVKAKYDDGELEWDKCAFHSSPNTAIKAGQKEL